MTEKSGAQRSRSAEDKELLVVPEGNIEHFTCIPPPAHDHPDTLILDHMETTGKSQQDLQKHPAVLQMQARIAILLPPDSTIKRRKLP